MYTLSVRASSADRNCRQAAEPTRRRWGLFSSLCFWTAVVLALAAGNTALAQSSSVTRIEEDWVVVMGAPDPNTNAPQICTVLSPCPDLCSEFVVFELNHGTQPDYVAGGMQLQGWVDDWIYEYRNFPNPGVAQTADEVVSYTVIMEVSGGNMKFEVRNGTSTTWGNFGGQGYLKLDVPTNFQDLTTYDSGTSVQHSRISFAAQRVQRFARKEVRYYSGNTLVATDSTEHVVHEHQAETN